MSRRPITEADLQAYVDGLLDDDDRAAVDAHLAVRPDDALRIRAYREQNQALRDHFAPEFDAPPPDRLVEAAFAGPVADRSTVRSRWSLGRIAAGFALVVAGGIIGWIARDPASVVMVTAQAPRVATQPTTPQPAALSTSLPHQAALAHAVFSPDIRRPVEISADQEDQLVAWLSKRLGSPVRPPKLGALGFELIGGRLLPGANGPVAQFMYHDAIGQRLTLYVSADNTANRDTAFRFAQEGPINVFYWIDGKFGYALSAGIGKGDLARLATTVYDQLQPGHPDPTPTRREEPQ